MQKEFTTPFEEISLQELKKCLQKFYLSARKSDGRGHFTTTTRILQSAESVFSRGLIGAINFKTSLGMRNLNKKAKTK